LPDAVSEEPQEGWHPQDGCTATEEKAEGVAIHHRPYPHANGIPLPY